MKRRARATGLFAIATSQKAATHVIAAADVDALGAVLLDTVTRFAKRRFVREEQIENALASACT